MSSFEHNTAACLTLLLPHSQRLFVLIQTGTSAGDKGTKHQVSGVMGRLWENAADSPEAVLEVALVAAAVGEAGAGRLGSADAAAVQAAVQFWLMKAEHLQQAATK